MSRKWSDAQLRAAVGDISVLGSIAAAARRHGIPARTLSDARRRLESDVPELEAPQDPLDNYLEKQARLSLKQENLELVRRLAESEARNAFAAAVAQSTPARIPRVTTRFSGKRREGMAVALASDWHVEETVNPESVAGRNEYHLKIAQRRAERFFDGTEWLIKFNRAEWEIHEALLWLGGDLLTGYIHEELEESNELSPTETVLWLRGVLGNGIRQLLEIPGLERLIVPCNYGNHGRTTAKRRIKTGYKNSYEWMLYHVLAGDFADDPRVEFVIPKSAHAYVEAYNYTLHFHHGDEVRYWGGVGGLHIPLGKRVPKWDNVKKADIHHIGHFHTLTDVGHTVVNGSLIGYSEYAFSIGAEYEPPQQAFYILDSERGKTNFAPIWVDEKVGK